MRRSRTLFATLALLLAAATHAAAQPAYMVADLGHYVWSLPWFYVNQMQVDEVNGVGFFFHDDGIHGSELWRTDGTALGTFMLLDLCPGLCGNRALAGGSWMAALGNQLIFTGNDGVHGAEIWRTDGTALGTVLVRDIHPGVAPSNPGQFLRAAGQVYFTANDGSSGTELWRSDGTAKGTFRVKDIAPGPANAIILHLAEGGGVLFLAVSGADTERGLWVSDGTTEGTVRVAEVDIQDSSPRKGTAFLAFSSGLLVFQATSSASGSELWRSDGTAAGTSLLADLLAGPDSSSPTAFVRFGDVVLFQANSAPSFPTRRLWRTDGTPAGTLQVPTPDGMTPHMDLGMHAVQGTSFAVFAGENPDSGLEPWVYDGVSVSSLGDLRPGPSSSLDALSNTRFDHAIFAATGDHVTFLADDGIAGLEFWSTNGTPAGTVRISDLFDDLVPPFFDNYAQLVDDPLLGSTLLVRQWDPAAGFRLLRSDGTAAGTGVVELLSANASSFFPRRDGAAPFAAMGPYCFEAAGAKLGFQIFNGESGYFEMWGSDGSEIGTAKLLDVAGDLDSFSTLGCTAFQERVYTLGDDAGTTSLWATAGTPESTTVVAPLEGSSSTGGSLRPYFAQSSSAIFFGAVGSLFSSDGTNEGTTALAPLAPFVYGTLCLAEPHRILFGEFELSVTSSLPGGEVLTIDLNGAEPSYPSNLAALVDGTVLFSAYDEALGSELWRSDGSAEGTFLVRDIRPGLEGSIENLFADISDEGYPPQIASFGLIAVLSADDGVHGAELWVSDGTALGTQLLKDIYPGDYPSTPRNLTRLGDRIFFSAESELEGLELWATDGTYEGTVLVKNIAPGAASSLPDDLVVRDGVLYFSAWSPNYGREAWKSDGTSAGTIRITDIAPGPKSSSPQRFARAGNRLFMSATDQVHGYELWAISDDGSIPLFLDGFENESTSRWSATEP